MNDDRIFEKAVERFKRSVKPAGKFINSNDIVVFLEKEIDSYRDKIENLETRIKKSANVITELRCRVAAINETERGTTLEAVEESTAADIIKALSDNDYNISISLYKNNEREV